MGLHGGRGRDPAVGLGHRSLPRNNSRGISSVGPSAHDLRERMSFEHISEVARYLFPAAAALLKAPFLIRDRAINSSKTCCAVLKTRRT